LLKYYVLNYQCFGFVCTLSVDEKCCRHFDLGKPKRTNNLTSFAAKKGEGYFSFYILGYVT